MIERLDVGCGLMSTGSVNCDLYPRADDGHREGQNCNPHLHENFVRCDAQFLPFKDKSFLEVYSAHTIEHVEYPALMMKEMLRVSRGKVIVICPHRLGDSWRLSFKRRKWIKEHHVNKLNKRWFNQIAKILGCFCICSYSRWLGVPHPYLALFNLPLEITVILQKKPI